MTDQNLPTSDNTNDDDVDGHGYLWVTEPVGDEMTDDAQGHGRSHAVEQHDASDDVEGHIAKFGVRDSSDDDVPGHGIKFGVREDDGDDDVEGHIRSRLTDDAEETDDVAGHLSGALGQQKRD